MTPDWLTVGQLSKSKKGNHDVCALIFQNTILLSKGIAKDPFEP